MIGVDRETRLRDVAQDRCVIAVNQVGQVRADGPALTVDRVALRARRLFAEELLAPARPTAAFQLFGACDDRGLIERLGAGVGPRQQDAMQLQWPGPLI